MPDFMTALSALDAHSKAIDAVGSNLANLNTTGYKAGVASFRDMVTQTVGPGGQIGVGVSPVTVQRQFAQGATQATSGPLDAAVQGDGFFLLRNLQGKELYTRAGNFRFDSSGKLLTTTGEFVQGWVDLTGTVTTTGPAGNIVIPTGTLKPPQKTTTFSLDLNLNAQAATGDVFSTSVDIHDSLGAVHTVSVTYTKRPANSWGYSISVPTADLRSAATPVTGTLTFDSAGKLDSSTAAPPTVSVRGWANGAADQEMTFQIFNGTTGRVTQYAQSSAVSAVAQDGSGAAGMLKVAIADGGKILASYSDGKTLAVGQLALVSFRNPDSLIPVGDNNFQVGADTSAPVIGLPETGGRGKVLGSALEASNVDLAREFTNLMVYQRGYQANAKVITTMDDLTQATLNLKQ